MAEQAVGMRVAALDEQSRRLQFVHRRVEPRYRRARQADREVGAQMRHQIGADPLGAGQAGQRDQGDPPVLDRAEGEHDDRFLGHLDDAAAGFHGNEATDRTAAVPWHRHETGTVR